MVVSPRLVPEKPAQRHGDLPVLISVGTGLNRARVPEDLEAYLDQLRKGVAGTLLFYRLAMSKRHNPIMKQRILSPLINIAHFSKEFKNETASVRTRRRANDAGGHGKNPRIGKRDADPIGIVASAAWDQPQ